MASTTLAVASGALGFGTTGDASPAGVDTVYGIAGTDTLATNNRGAATGGDDRYLDDAGGLFDAALGYALAFQHLLAEAWKGEASTVLHHLDQGGSCAPGLDAEPPGNAPWSGAVASAGSATSDLPLGDADAAADGPCGDGGGDSDFADASVAGGDFFGMS